MGIILLQILSPDGSNLFKGNVSLTGNAINVQQASMGVVGFFQYTWVWVVILLILVFVIFLFVQEIT